MPVGRWTVGGGRFSPGNMNYKKESLISPRPSQWKMFINLYHFFASVYTKIACNCFSLLSQYKKKTSHGRGRGLGWVGGGGGVPYKKKIIKKSPASQVPSIKQEWESLLRFPGVGRGAGGKKGGDHKENSLATKYRFTNDPDLVFPERNFEFFPKKIKKIRKKMF